MFAAERYTRIRKMLEEDGHVDVMTICASLSISEATARRDLEKLERDGYLRRTHGGAVLLESNKANLNLVPNSKMADEHESIAKVAEKFIQDGDFIFVNSGDISLCLVERLKNLRSVTVVTNSINCVVALAQFRHIHVIAIGGSLEVREQQLFLTGQQAIKDIQNLFFSKAFFTVDGISTEYGYTVQSLDEAELLKAVSQNSSEVIVMADYTKFGSKSFARIGDVTLSPKVITNIQVDAAYKQYYYEHNIQLFTGFQETLSSPNKNK